MELRDALAQALGAGFRIERELGGGGMSRVFLARDLALDRDIVVKVLPADGSGAADAGRFRREIQVVARLQHPHVVSILSAGVADGALYYTMPFIGGETLRARLTREGPLPVADAVRTLRELLDALSFAHRHGVVHRDIKPENVLVEAGHVIVADFGIAKALRESGSMTSVGVSLGTPAYMAPEQALADPAADHRVDLYALGVMAFELLTGKPPFGGSPQQVIAAHISTPPAPLATLRPDAPRAVCDLVMRALEKDPAARPQSAAEMLAALDAAVTPVSGATAGVYPATLAAQRARPARGRLLVGVAVAVAIIAAVSVWAVRPPVARAARSMAIMPFSAPSGDSALVRLGRDLVSTLSVSLDGVGELTVADAAGSLGLAGAKPQPLVASDAALVARQLGATSVLTGTIALSGGTVRVDAQLRDVSDTAAVLARVSATAPMGELTALTDSLVWAVLRQVWQRGQAPSPALAAVTTRSVPALRAFLDGERSWSDGDIVKAGEHYLRAVETDTTFWFAGYRYWLARAWFGLPSDSTVTRRLGRHLDQVPERERLLVLLDSSKSRTERLERARELTRRWPDYAPGWMMLGDPILHSSAFAGVHPREALPAIRRWAELMPGDVSALGHLGVACVVAADLACAAEASARLDSMAEARHLTSGVTQAEGATLRLAVGKELDSVGMRALTDSQPLLWVGLHSSNAAAAYSARPGLAEAKRYAITRMSSAATRIPAGFSQELWSMISAGGAIEMGDWTEVRFQAAESSAELMADRSMRQAVVRQHLFGEWMGLVTPSGAMPAAAALVLADSGASAGLKAEARFMVASHALLTGDSATLGGYLTSIAKDTSARAATAIRSLRAVRLGLSGDRKAAAESLLVIERVHGDRYAGALLAAMGINRLWASRWLQETSQYAAADSLTRFVRMWASTPATSSLSDGMFAPLMLERARILEALGQREEALMSARAVVNTQVMASAPMKPIVEEARRIAARLAVTDKAPSRTVPAKAP